MSDIPNITEATDNVEKLGNSWQKNPWGITVALSVAMFLLGFFVRHYSSDDSKWINLYEQEKKRADRVQQEMDDLKNLFIMNRGLIEQQQKIIKKADSTLREKTQPDAEKILNTQ